MTVDVITCLLIISIYFTVLCKCEVNLQTLYKAAVCRNPAINLVCKYYRVMSSIYILINI